MFCVWNKFVIYVLALFSLHSSKSLAFSAADTDSPVTLGKEVNNYDVGLLNVFTECLFLRDLGGSGKSYKTYKIKRKRQKAYHK